MLSKEFGRHIRNRREALRMPQAALAERANVSRAVLSKLESQRGSPVQTDVLDKLLDGLGAKATVVIGEPHASPGQIEERLRARVRQEELRNRHLRIALELCANPQKAKAKIKRALQQVSLWEERQSCSDHYISRWREALRHEPRGVALAMTSFGEWENAMFQNTPWAFLWS